MEGLEKQKAKKLILDLIFFVVRGFKIAFSFFQLLHYSNYIIEMIIIHIAGEES